MFSKIRKHLNIMWILLILLTIMLGIVFVGVISIDGYCDDNVNTTIQNQEKIVASDYISLTRNIGNTLDMLEISLKYEPDAITALQNGLGSENPAVQNNHFDNCLAVISGNYYNVKSTIESAEINYKEFDWYQGAYKQKDGALYVSTSFKDDYDGVEYIAFSKYVVNGDYVLAVCIETDKLVEKFDSVEKCESYLINVNGDVIATTDEENIGINVVEDATRLKNGHDEVLAKVDKINKNTTMDTKEGEMYASAYTITSNLKYVVIREASQIVNSVSGEYLKILTAIIAMIPTTIGLYIMAEKYIRKVRDIDANKCGFIESLALEIRIPLETIGIATNELQEYMIDETVRKHLESIIQSKNAIAFDLNSMFDYSKIALNELKIENSEYKVESIIKNVEKAVHSDMKKNDIYFDSFIEGNEKLIVYGDQRKIEEIIINLVKFSASQTMEGGVELRVMYADLTADRVNLMLIIRDTGIGMNDHELTLFSEGLKTYNRYIPVEHTGIGLEMVKQLVKMLNAKIVVDSTKNVGTVYTVMIPQKLVIDEDNRWQDENVKNSTDLMQLYSRMDKVVNDYSFITTGIEKDVNIGSSTGVERNDNILVPVSIPTPTANIVHNDIPAPTANIVHNDIPAPTANMVHNDIPAAMPINEIASKPFEVNSITKNDEVDNVIENNIKEKKVKEKKIKEKKIKEKKVKEKKTKDKVLRGKKKINSLEDMIHDVESMNDGDGYNTLNDMSLQSDNMSNSTNDEVDDAVDLYGSMSMENKSVDYQQSQGSEGVDYLGGTQDSTGIDYQGGMQDSTGVDYLGGMQYSSGVDYESKMRGVGESVDYQPTPYIEPVDVPTLQPLHNEVKITEKSDLNNKNDNNDDNNNAESKYNEVRKVSATQYLDDDTTSQNQVDNDEEDPLEKEMREKMAAQADGLLTQMANREAMELKDKNSEKENLEFEIEESEAKLDQNEQIESAVVDKRVELLQVSIGQVGIDVQKILAEYGNNIDNYENVLIEFYKYSKTNANVIINMWNQKQINEYFVAINTAKEGAKAVGFESLSNILEEQLQKGRSGELKFVASTIKDMFVEWKKVLAAIAQYVKSKSMM